MSSDESFGSGESRPDDAGQDHAESKSDIQHDAPTPPPVRLGESSEIVDAAGSARQPPTRVRELAAVGLLVALTDLTIYQGQGYAGFAVLLACAPSLLMLGSTGPRPGAAAWFTGIMLAALSVKLVWCGSALAVVAGLFLLVSFAMSLAGLTPHVLETVVYASQTVLAGYAGAIQHWRWFSKTGPAAPRVSWLNVGIPAIVCLLFSWLFVLANPRLLTFFSDRTYRLFISIRDFVFEYSPPTLEIGFWLAVAWISVGLLRPVMGPATFGRSANAGDRRSPAAPETAPAAMYPAFRNTLVTVIVLFAVYLGFEYYTLWSHDIPTGFHYSGYAHEGAAWLTVALALSTALLSLVFKGAVMKDPRLPILRRLAWTWSLQNFLLAVAVYHRLYIYVGFNGMTRMRIVGIYGMSAVAVGFILVLWKISRRRNFVWLMRRHLWTVAAFVYLYAITPVDMIVVSYNVRRILAGDPAPSVQISVHPIDSEGLLLLRPLLDCDDETIREGVRALLAGHHDEAEARAATDKTGWTAYQLSDRLLLNRLRASSNAWTEYADLQRRDAALERFHDYAFQWY